MPCERPASAGGAQQRHLEELRNYYLILPDMKESERPPEMPEGFLHGLLCQSPDQKKVEVETVANVIPLVEKDNESYALSFWPAARRYRGVQEGRLVCVPIADECAGGQFMLFYSRQACEHYPVVRQMVEDIHAAARRSCRRTRGRPARRRAAERRFCTKEDGPHIRAGRLCGMY